MKKLLIPVLVLPILLLLQGCASLPNPTIEDRYAAIDGAPSVGLSVNDLREKQKVGSIGLSTFNMGDLSGDFFTILRNQLNGLGEVNIMTFRKKEGDDFQNLRIPVLIEVDLETLNFVSADALLDDADGKASSTVRVTQLDGSVILSKTYTVENKMGVSWPNMNKNNKIVLDLLEQLTDKIVSDPELIAAAGLK